MNKVDSNFDIKTTQGRLRYYDGRSKVFQHYGFYSFEHENEYLRLSLSNIEALKSSLPKIAYLATNTAGGQLHFWTDSDTLSVQVHLTHSVDLSQMTRSGQGGFDCYIGSSFQRLQFIDCTRFDHGATMYHHTFFEGLPGKKLIVLNFPLYTGIQSLQIGLSNQAWVKPAKSFQISKRIVVYGTSIAQGGCASRPGLSYLNWLSRRMKREVLNFGFSGNAFGDLEVLEHLALISPASLFVLDYEANGGTNGRLEASLHACIQTIRKQHPKTPIVVVSRIPYILDALKSELGYKREKIRVFQESLISMLTTAGDCHLYYIDGRHLLGKEWHEGTTDAIHPNDYGFYEMTKAFEKALKKILQTDRRKCS